MIVFGVVFWLARHPLMTAAGGALVEDDAPQKADLAVVFGGDQFGSRVITAAKLVGNGFVPYVLVSYPVESGPPECQNTIGFALSQGYPASMFRELPSHSDSTRSEVQVIDAYLRQHSLHKVMLVTSNYHTRRAGRLMRHQDPALRVVVISAPDVYFSPSTWWKTRNGQKTFLLEWCKTIATAFGI